MSTISIPMSPQRIHAPMTTGDVVEAVIEGVTFVGGTALAVSVAATVQPPVYAMAEIPSFFAVDAKGVVLVASAFMWMIGYGFKVWLSCRTDKNLRIDSLLKHVSEVEKRAVDERQSLSSQIDELRSRHHEEVGKLEAHLRSQTTSIIELTKVVQQNEMKAHHREAAHEEGID